MNGFRKFKIIFIVFIVAACNSHEANQMILESFFDIKDSAYIDINMPYNFAASNLQVIEKSDGKEYLLINDMQYFKIFEIDLDQRKLNRIIDLSAIENLTYRSFQFYYINDDSILLFRDPIFDRHYMDNAFVFSNSDGELFGEVDLSGSSFRLKGQNNVDSGIGIIDNYVHPFAIFENNIVFAISPFKSNNLSFSERKKFRIPLFAGLLKSKKAYNYFELPHPPKEDILVNYTDEQQCFSYTFSPNGKLYFSYGFESAPSFFDLRTNTYFNSKGVKSSFNLTTPPIPLDEDLDEDDFPFGNHTTNYFQMFYDNNNEAVIRLAYLPFETNDLSENSLFELRNRLRGFSVFSDDLRLQAEGVVPLWFAASFSNPVNTKQGLVTLMRDSTCATCIPLAFFEVKTKPATTEKWQALKDSLNNFTDEFVQMKQNEDDQRLADLFGDDPTVVLMLPAYGCPACIMGYLHNLNENIDKLIDQDLLIIIGNYDYGDTEEVIANLESNLSNLIVMDLDDLSDIFPIGEQTPILFKWDGTMKLHKVTLGNSPKSLFSEIDSLRLAN
ncbi:MAG: hypothetical protein JJU02_13495 [Cryomorphaceae bacterium]|nr:hypothetical protein [Cryomorphaceae bacterium]